jgi:alpha-beta hydrolase superfamily lysophospholipase
MGSYLAQSFLLEHSKRVDLAILSGSTAQPAWLSSVAGQLARLEGRLRGPQTPAKAINRLSFGSFNRAIKQPRTEFDWLSRDVAEVDLYVNDPLCGFVLSCHFWHSLFGALRDIADGNRLRHIRHDLPLLIIGGDRDPVSAPGGLQRLHRRLCETGLKRVELRVYAGARHELFNETNRQAVTADMLDWLNALLSQHVIRNPTDGDA